MFVKRRLIANRRAILCVAAVFSATGLVQAADSADSAPVLISRTAGQGGGWSSIAELKKAAEAHNPRACAQYGDALLRGDGVKQDTAQAMMFLREAFDAGEPNAAFRLGKIYDDGEHAPQDFAKAFSYYAIAAKAGVVEAQYNLGVLYVSARGTKRDYVEGLAWLIVATKKGATGEGEEKTREQMQKIKLGQLISAAEKRAAAILKDPSVAEVNFTPPKPVAPANISPPAKVDLGDAPSKPGTVKVAPPSLALPDVSKNIESRLNTTQELSPPVSLVTPRQTIKSWTTLMALRAEAAQREPIAMWAVAKVHLDGKLVPADPKRAMELFEEAATAGSADAAYQLGEMYSCDTYVPHDDTKAFNYFKQAALGKVRPGYYNLGACYMNGSGTPKDVVEGLAWLIVAKKHDIDPHAEGIARIRLQNSDPAKIPLAEKRAEQIQKELFPEPRKAARK
ncbi:MAG: tetratricopeptide repeat protein [Nibricoccus sp.]